MIINWRRELCRVLDLSIEPTDDELLEKLESAYDELQEAKRLKMQRKEQQGSPRFQLINKVQCHETRGRVGLYLDPPWVVDSGRHGAHLRTSNPIRNLELYLERHKDLTFIVYREFECCQAPLVFAGGDHTPGYEIDPLMMLKKEYIDIISDELRGAMIELSETALQGLPHPNFQKHPNIRYPYLWWFHRRNDIDAACSLMGPAFQEHINVLREYFIGRLQDEWKAVEELLSRGQITAAYMEYLYVRSLRYSGLENG